MSVRHRLQVQTQMQQAHCPGQDMLEGAQEDGVHREHLRAREIGGDEEQAGGGDEGGEDT